MPINERQFEACVTHVKEAIEKTCETLLPQLAGHFELSEDNVQAAIGLATATVAIDQWMESAVFSEDDRKQMVRSIIYLVNGAITVRKVSLKDEV